MRTIERSTVFRRDYKREGKGRYRATLDDDLEPVILALAGNERLEPHHRDHPLGGEWSGYRECHIKPDLLLIYQLPDAETLWLVRLGSHSELFG